MDHGMCIHFDFAIHSRFSAIRVTIIDKQHDRRDAKRYNDLRFKPNSNKLTDKSIN